MGTVAIDLPLEQALTTTLTEVAFGPGVDIIVINADADIYVVVGPYGAGQAVPPNRYRVPSGICHPFRRSSGRLWVAALTGTATQWAWAHLDHKFFGPVNPLMECP